MTRTTKLFTFAGILLAALISQPLIAWTDETVSDGDPGTVGACLAQADGSTATVFGARITKVGHSGRSFSIEQAYVRPPAQPPRLLVVSRQHLPGNDAWVIDVTGTLVTLTKTMPNGGTLSQRALVVSPENVTVFCCADGTPFIFPPIQGLGEDWPDKWPLPQVALTGTDDAQAVPAASVHALDDGDGGDLAPADDTEGDPPPGPMPPDNNCYYDRIPDGGYVEVNERVVSEEVIWDATDPNETDYFWVGSPNRTWGIYVQSQGWAFEGDLLCIAGQMATAGDGERIILPGFGYTLGEGLPLPRPIGLNIKSLASGAAPVERRVRIWGPVTVPTTDTYPIIPSFTLGNGVTVYDNYHWHNVGDYDIITGILSKMADSTGKMIPVVFQAYDDYATNEPRGPASHTISGAVLVDTVAAGQTVTIGTDSGQTSCVLDSTGCGTYSLTLLQGNYTISAETAGYSTSTVYGLVDNDYEVDFYYMYAISTDFVVATPARVAPEGVATVNVWCHDAEARSKPYAQAPWTTDDGREGTATADSNGNATISLGTTPLCHLITVNVGNDQDASGSPWTTYIQVANPDDPFLFITNPANGGVSGFVEVDVTALNSDGSAYPLSGVQLCVDGAPEGGITIPDPDTGDSEPSGIETERLTNGQHTLSAWCLGPEGDTVWSQNVYINVNNAISSLTPTCLEIFRDDPSPNSIGLTAQMSVPGTWSVQITDQSNNVVYSNTGTGPGTMTASWDGKQNGSYVDGIYTVTISAADSTATQLASKTLYATVSPGNGDALVCIEVRDSPYVSDTFHDEYYDEMIAVSDGCRARGLRCTLVIDPLWMERYEKQDGQIVQVSGYPYAEDPDMGNLRRLTIGGWLAKPYHYFFYAGHGDWDSNNYERIQFVDELGGMRNVAGIVSPPNPANPALSDIGINPSQYRIVELNLCWSGGNIDNGYWAEVGIPQAFFGMGAPGSLSGQLYVGWVGPYGPRSIGVPVIDGLFPCGTQWTSLFWSYLGEYCGAEQAAEFATDEYAGFQANYLYGYGDWDTTWLYP